MVSATEERPQIEPQRGFLGMTMADVVFHPHEMSHDADAFEAELDTMSPEVRHLMKDWVGILRSTKHAIVEFPNGARISIITGIPADGNNPRNGSRFKFAKGDARIPTYEVSVSKPGIDSVILADQTPEDINQHLKELASL